MIALPCASLVIPIGIDNLMRVAGAQRVTIAGVDERAKRLSCFWTGKSISLPAKWIITIKVIWNDIKIAAKNNGLFAGDKRGCALI